MYIQRNKKSKTSGGHYESALLCHKYRENGVVKTKVLANLSMLPAEALLSLENSLKANQHGETVFSEKDIAGELSQIKIVEYNLGKKVQKIQITKLTQMQEKIFKALKIKENDLIKFKNVATNRKKN